MNNRAYSDIASEDAKQHLNNLLNNTHNVEAYRESMVALGGLLVSSFVENLNNQDECLLVSTAEDADYLLKGVADLLRSRSLTTKLAVFWNNHYQVPGTQQSVAPIVQKFIEPGADRVKNIIIVKSVMSGSCVVRTNMLSLLSQVKTAENIFILAPVVHANSEQSLKKEFPAEISEKFNFVYFAKDEEKAEDGEVIPGIGGQIYELLGLQKQPALTGYMPSIVEKLAFS